MGQALIIFGLINFWGIKLLSRSNIILTTVKIIIPLITAIAIIATSFHSENFFQNASNHSGFMPYGLPSVFTAMLGAGMIYSFNGFQNIVSFASETKHPQRNIPLAMLLSVCITLFVYIMLQTSFIGTLSPSLISNGWHNLNFTSPFVQITMMLNLNLITIILYADAVLSPSGTGLIYAGSTTRMLTGMSEDTQMPAFFKKLSKYNFSRRSLIATILLAIVFLLLFKSWESLVSFLSLFYIISYMSIPLCLGKLRYNKITSKFSIPCISYLLPLMFIFLSILFVFAKAPYTIYVAAFIGLAFGIYIFTQMKLHYSFNHLILRSCPILLHVTLLAGISYIGPKIYGGLGWLNHTLFLSSIIIIALIVYYLTVFVTAQQLVN